MTTRLRQNGARRRTRRECGRRRNDRQNEGTLNYDLSTHALLVVLLTFTFAASLASARHRQHDDAFTDELRRLPATQKHKGNSVDDMTAADQIYEPITTLLNNNNNNQDDHDHDDETAASYALDNSAEAVDTPFSMTNTALHHNSQLRAMRDLFERRHLGPPSTSTSARMGQSSQELSPISIGLDPNSPFGMVPPFDGASPPPSPRGLSNADEPNGGPVGLPFGMNTLPHLLGFQGPQPGDKSAHSNHHTAAAVAAASQADGSASSEPELRSGGQKVWPKIFRFTDGRINLSDFEKQKKIRLSSKNQHGENHIESAPIMFDGRQLKRKSFLILHGGVFPGNR